MVRFEWITCRIPLKWDQILGMHQHKAPMYHSPDVLISSSSFNTDNARPILSCRLLKVW